MKRPDFIETVLASTAKRIAQGYYNARFEKRKKRSLVSAIEKTAALGKTPVIAEIKPVSPTMGKLFAGDALALAKELVEGGACALSVLTEPEFFGGSAEFLRNEFEVPVLQKDFVYDERQFLDGADAVLLIQAVLGKKKISANKLISAAHARGLEVLIEAHSLEEFKRAVKTKADLIGINNRDLKTLKIDLKAVEKILKKARTRKIVVAESGIESRKDVEKMLRAGAKAVLVGTGILKSKNMRKKVAELVG